MLPFIGLHTHLGKLLFRGFRRQAIQVIIIDEPNNLRFILLDDQMVALPAVAIDLKAAVWNALFKPLSRSPFYIVGNAAAFLLCKGCEDGQHQFAVPVHRADVLLLKTHLNAQVF